MDKIKLESIKKFGSYLVVGGGATIVEWCMYWIFKNVFSIEYLVATILAIIVSTFSNWLLGRLITFKGVECKNVFMEIAKVYAVSIVGLLINIAIMKLLHGMWGWWDMLAKVIATGVALVFNYAVRVLYIYKNSEGKTAK